MASTFEDSVPWGVSGSPSESTIQRGNPVAKHSRDGSVISPRKDDSTRLRHLSSPPPGKENFPLNVESRGRAEGKPSKMSFFRNKSPERRGNSKPKGRSVSPTKRDKRDVDREFIDDSGTTIVRSTREIDADFVKMLSEMEVSVALRQKLMALDPKVKESMMKGQATLSLAGLATATSSKARPAISDLLRKSKSSGSMMGEVGGWQEDYITSPPDRTALFGGSQQARNTSGNSTSSISSTEAKGSKKSSLLSPALNTSTAFLPGSAPRSRSASFSSVAYGASGSSAAAATFATMLKTTDSSRLDVAQVKKMRAVLSSESPTWIGEFVQEGGYSAMVTRLKELLNLEWREEQHDDQLLHELLRCFVALSTTDRGRMTLQSMTPTPFVELSALLFSEKRPGDLSTRKLLVELLTMLADLPGTNSANEIEPVRNERESSTVSSAIRQTSDNFVLLFILLHNLRDPTQEAKVDFITASHAPRPFKTFIAEILNLNRDYFWVFCHSNRFWSLQDINVDQVECPKVPGGMTGGVEFEAMAYLTSLLRLLNTTCSHLSNLAKAQRNRSITYDFHSLLFSSGIDRALATTRKASQTYYQPLHLELARYFDHARQSGFQIPVELEAWQASPRLLQTTEYRYFDSKRVAKEPSGPNSSRSYSPDKPADRRSAATAGQPFAQKRAETPSDDNRKADILSGTVSNNTGKWLGGTKRISQDAALQGFDKEAEVALLSFGPRLHNPHEGNKAESSYTNTQTPQASSMVGNAVQKWEQLTAKHHQGGLGLGWAPPR